MSALRQQHALQEAETDELRRKLSAAREEAEEEVAAATRASKEAAARADARERDLSTKVSHRHAYVSIRSAYVSIRPHASSTS